MNELYHHGVKGMKWGVRKDKKSLIKTSIKTRAKYLKHPVRSFKTGVKVSTESLKHPIGAIKFTSKNFGLIKKYKQEYLSIVNKKLDRDPSIKIGKDFFKQHQNDRLRDILKDDNTAAIAWLMLMRHT